MRKLPKHIKDKVYQHSKYAKNTEKLRLEIEKWFISQGMEYENDVDLPITDILVDNEHHPNEEGTIELLETALNEI